MFGMFPLKCEWTVLGARTLIFSETPLPPGQALSSLSPRRRCPHSQQDGRGVLEGPSHREVPGLTCEWGWSGGCAPFSPDSSLPHHPR